MVGPQGVRDHLVSLMGAFPDLKFEVDDMVAQGEQIVVRWTARGNNTGDYFGMPATGKPIESWGELLNKDYKGKVALLNVPQIGVMDAAMAIEALGLKKFGDKGNMTKPEIDFLIDYLIPLKKAGHFRAFWENFGQSVNLMVNGEVALESMWSPAVAAIQAEGVPCVYAFPKEGMRGWHGGLAISAKVKGKQLDQAYEYINWWLSGWAPAFVARQGYYHSIPENAKKFLDANAPGFWDAADSRETLERYRSLDVAIEVESRFARTLDDLDRLVQDAASWRNLASIARIVEAAAHALHAWQARAADESARELWLLISRTDPMQSAEPWLIELAKMEMAWCQRVHLHAAIVAASQVAQQSAGSGSGCGAGAGLVRGGHRTAALVTPGAPRRSGSRR